MKWTVTSAALVGVALFAPPAGATAFSYSGSIATYTVPTTGDYLITAIGAAGGVSEYYDYSVNGVNGAGGEGAEAQGMFSLTAGTTLDVLVGQQGAEGYDSGGGGGGGSFVVISGGNALAVGGGGGGGGYYGYSSSSVGAYAGADASTTSSGNVGSNPYPGGYGAGGTAGNGGVSDYGSGGGGLLTDGNADGEPSNDYGTPGAAFVNGGAGGEGSYGGYYGAAGGFGGGGGGSYYGGAGGGGYSGGGGGGIYAEGGGGGSYLDPSALAPILLADMSTGDGSVTIALVPAPEPASLAVFASGLLVVGFVLSKRRTR